MIAGYVAGVFSGLAFAVGIAGFYMLRSVGEVPAYDPASPSP